MPTVFPSFFFEAELMETRNNETSSNNETDPSFFFEAELMETVGLELIIRRIRTALASSLKLN